VLQQRCTCCQLTSTVGPLVARVLAWALITHIRAPAEEVHGQRSDA
jgi:hypothetical protein